MTELNVQDVFRKLTNSISDTISKDKDVIQFLDQYKITDDFLKQAVNTWLRVSTCRVYAQNHNMKELQEYCERIIPHIEDTLTRIFNSTAGYQLENVFDTHCQSWLDILEKA